MTNPYVTARHSIKRSDGNYGSEEFSAEIYVPLDPAHATDSEYRMQQADLAFSEAEAVLRAQMDGEPNVVSIASAPSANHPSMQPQPAPQAAPMSAQAVADHLGGTLEIPDDPAFYTGTPKAWAKARVQYLLANDQTKLAAEWWDNRVDKRNPKAPDFKNKANGDHAVWL